MNIVAILAAAASIGLGTNDAIWPAVTPQYYDHTGDLACSVRGAYFKGDFISAADDIGAKGPHKFVLRRRFAVKSAPVEAWLQGMGDLSAKFALNGKPAFFSHYDHMNCMNQISRKEVHELLKVGENELTIDYDLGENFEYGVQRPFAGGAMAELFVRYADGSFDRVNTDGSFESSTDGKTWKGVVTSPKPPYPPRSSRYEYVDYANPQKNMGGGMKAAKVNAGEITSIAYKFKGKAPEDDFTIKVWIVKDGSVYFDTEVEVSRNQVTKFGDNYWRFEVPFEVPLYIHGGDYEFAIGSNSIYCREGGAMKGTLAIVEAKTIPGYETSPKMEMRSVNGKPTIFKDGEPFALLWGGIQQEKRPDRKPHHSDMPLTAATVYNEYRTWHPNLETYDFSSFDNQAEKYRRANPEAYFIWDLTVYPPNDFMKKFPAEMASDDDGDVEPVGRFSWSYASKIGLEEIQTMVEKAIRYLEASPYANRIIGYRVNSGVTIEWLGWDAKNGKVRDFSENNRKAFADFAAEHYPELKDPHVPNLAERTDVDAKYDILWNREKHLNTIAYMDYNSWIIAKDLLETCGRARETLADVGRQKLIGTYYGYTFYLNNNGRDQRRGHFALEYLLDNNDGRVDFLMSPQSYGERRFGDTCGDMKPFTTMEAAGILPINEDDTRTHNRLYPNWYGFHQTVTPSQTESLLRRSGSIVLCHNSVPYFYALADGLDLSSPECGEVGRDFRDIMEFCKGRAIGRHAEVALVASEKSVIALPTLMGPDYAVQAGRIVQDYEYDGSVSRGEPDVSIMNGEIFSNAHTMFARAGAPVDYMLAEDLKNRPGDYKVYVFLNLFVYDDKTLEAVNKLRERGATLVWLYAPGYLNDNTLESMKRLTGIEFAKVEGPVRMGLSVKEDGRWMGLTRGLAAQAFSPVNADAVLGTYENGMPALSRSKVGDSISYFSGTWQLDLELVKAIEREAGVHVYCDANDPMEANDAFFTLHARNPGLKTVKLPRKATVVDVFSRRVIAKDADEFTFEAKLLGSYLFYFGPEAERFAEGGKKVKFPSKHTRFGRLVLKDRTDKNTDLCQTDEQLLLGCIKPFTGSAAIFYLEDSLTGRGRVFLKKGPLPESRADKRPDYRVDAAKGELTLLDNSYDTIELPYVGGEVGRIASLQEYQRLVRQYVPGRDGTFLSNTWGDGNRDACINEAFMQREIEAGAELGVDVIQIDDGWQKGHSANSAKLARGEKGSWGKFRDDPTFWEFDPVRFPNGIAPLVKAAREKNLKFGLWYGPDSSNDFAAWREDAEFLLKLHRDYGVDYFKLDSMKSETALSQKRQQRLFERLQEGSAGAITVDLDVTAGVRPGYFGVMSSGPVFVENRYVRDSSETRIWWPHRTLRELWLLSHAVDPVRMRMEVLNPERHPEYYGDDPLAPMKWPRDAIFAISMFASPLGWFEIQNLSPATMAAWKPLVARWREERKALHTGTIYPVGSVPDGINWTGFVSAAGNGSGYVLVFRERNERADFSLDLSPYWKKLPVAAEVIGGRGQAKVIGDRLEVTVPAELDFVWVKLR